MPKNQNAPVAGPMRRLLAMLYDALLLFGVLFIAAIPLAFIPEATQTSPAIRMLTRAYLLAICATFFVWFWVHGGQTLGMRAWRLRLVADDGRPVTARPALLRFFSAMLSLASLGLGFLWVLFDRDRLAWHDRLSRTRLIVVPKHGSYHAT